MRAALVGMAGCLCLAGGTSADPGPSERPWAGINPGHGTMLTADPAYAAAAVRETLALGLRISRIGIDGVGGKTAGAAFDWTARDHAIDQFLAAGLEVRGVISFRSHVAQTGDIMANWRYFARSVAAHYAGRVDYYIIDNEPDLADVPPETAVAMTCAAYAAIKSVSPTIRVESPPTASAGASYLQRMIELGVTRCADVLGVHSYGGQLQETHKLGLAKPWQFMADSGQPVIPVANSEGGSSFSWAPAAAGDPYRWQARWYALSYVQHKRYAYNSLLLFGLRSPRGLWDVASWRDGRFVPNGPVYDAVRTAFRELPFANGGFEEASEDERRWVVIQDMEAVDPPELRRVAFDAAPARSGQRAMGMTGPVQVRQVADRLVPGRPVTVEAWVRVRSGEAALKALGYDRLDGTAETVAAISRPDAAWQMLQLAVTPTSSWIVVSLEAGRGAEIAWDDVTVRPATGALN